MVRITTPAIAVAMKANRSVEDVLEGALHVEAAAIGAGEREGRGEIDHDAGERDHEHRGPLDVRRFHQPPDPLEQDHRRQRHEGDAVDLGGEDLSALEAERVAACRRPARKPRGHKGQPDRSGIGEHVGSVGEQRQRGRQQADHYLHGHEPEDQAERKPEPTPVGGADVRVRVRMVSVVVRHFQGWCHALTGGGANRANERLGEAGEALGVSQRRPVTEEHEGRAQLAQAPR